MRDVGSLMWALKQATVPVLFHSESWETLLSLPCSWHGILGVTGHRVQWSGLRIALMAEEGIPA